VFGVKALLVWQSLSSLRLDLAGRRLRDDLAISHDVRVSRHLVYVVGGFGGSEQANSPSID
jgi:hypothetical protein